MAAWENTYVDVNYPISFKKATLCVLPFDIDFGDANQTTAPDLPDMMYIYKASSETKARIVSNKNNDYGSFVVLAWGIA